MSKKTTDAATAAGAVAAKPDTAPASTAGQQPATSGAGAGDNSTTSDDSGPDEPEPTEGEKQLAQALATMTDERDHYKTQSELSATQNEELNETIAQLTSERDHYKRLSEGEPDAGTDTEQPSSEAVDADPHAETKDLLKRNGLTKAWVLAGNVSFSEKYAREWAGSEEEFNNLEVISISAE